MSRLPILLLVLAFGCGGGDPDAEPPALPGLLPLPAPDEASSPAPPAAPEGGSPSVTVSDPDPAAPTAPGASEAAVADHLAGYADGPLRVYVLGVGTAYDDPGFLGLVVSCDAGAGVVEATVTHGLFPDDTAVSVRTAVHSPDGGDPEVFGPSRYPMSGSAVPHESLLVDPADVGRLVRSAFVPDAVVTNGHRPFRNALSAERNAAALDEVLACPALGS